MQEMQQKVTYQIFSRPVYTSGSPYLVDDQPLGWGGKNTHPRTLPRVVKGDQKGQWRRCPGSALYGGAEVLAAPKNDTGHSS
jgi:hypothetical protein